MTDKIALNIAAALDAIVQRESAGYEGALRLVMVSVGKFIALHRVIEERRTASPS